MDQIKIGRFIVLKRKEKELTQMQLAEKLGITDRAVSKWENGKSLPDYSIILQLCEVLEITVNDLLCGEVITMDNYNKELENNLLEMIKQKQQSDKRLLYMEILTGIVCIIPLAFAAVFVSIVPMKEWVAAVITLSSLVPILVAMPFMLKIEQVAGYYECGNCHHRYVPKYSSVFMAPHMGRTRYMRCPKCGKRSWQKKVLTKE